MNVSLKEREQRLDDAFDDIVDELRDKLSSQLYRKRLRGFARWRLGVAHIDKDDSMYGWDTWRRETEQDERLADYIVFGSSEP